MWSFFTSSSKSETNKADQMGCPMKTDNQRDNMDKSAHTTQLGTDRVISSIPRYQAASSQESNLSACPVNHSSSTNNTETTEQQNWVYPSPSQFYQALQRKNRNPRAEDMHTVVPIHNAVNERVWTQVLEWEAQYGKGAFDRWPRSGKSGPMLCSFRGRPNDLSPRAWIRVLSGYQSPFDRHDWEVVRPTEQRMRYVVDFYAGRGADNVVIGPDGGGPNLAFYLDVRPALDSWEGVRMRFLRATHHLFNSFPSLSFSSSESPSPQPPQKKF